MNKRIYSQPIKQTQLFIGRLAFTLIIILSAIAHAGAQGYETTSIEISDFSLTPSVIDTTSSSQAVTITIRGVSPYIPISFIAIHFRSHTGLQFRTVLIKSEHLIAGNSNDGVYRIEAIFPRYSKAGDWSIFQIVAFADRNYRTFYKEDLDARGFVTQLHIISLDEDITPPELREFSFTPVEIDTTNGSQTVTVTLRATDAKIGVRNVSVGFSRTGDDYLYPVFSMNRISGDEKDGVYRGSITFSPNGDSGLFNAHVFLADELFNNKGFDELELAARGFSSHLKVNNSSQATASISGKVLNAAGRGISKAMVTFRDTGGNVRYAVTNPFGYYRFDNINLGAAYTLNVTHKGYSFTVRSGFVDSESISLNFTANPSKTISNRFEKN